MADKKVFSIQIDGIQQSVNGVENLGNAVDGNVSSIKELRTALKATKDEMAGLDKNTKQWQDLAKVAGDYKDRIDDINQATARFASDTKALDDALNNGKSMTSVYTLAQGAMNAFGMSTEGVVEQIQKMQNAMGILQSIQSLQNTLKGSTATTDLLTKAMKACTVSMEGTSTAAKVLKVSLMSIGIGLIIAAISELIIHWDDLTEAIGLSNKAAEEANETFEAGIGTYAKAKAELTAYISKLETFNGTKEQEAKLVEECNKKYGDAFGHYSTLSQWKDVLIKKTEAYCKSLMLEAQMQAKINQLTKAYEDAAKAKKDFDRLKEGDLTFWEQVKDFVSPGGALADARDGFADARKEVSKLEAEIEEFAKQIAENNMNNELFDFSPSAKKGGKKTQDEAKKQLEELKKIYGDWRKAELKAEEEFQKEMAAKKKAEEEKLLRLAKLRASGAKAEEEYQKQKLKLDLEYAESEEEKIEIKKKIIALDQKIAEEEKKAAAADAMGISISELQQRLDMTEGKWVGLNEEQKQVLQTLQTQLATIKMAAEEANKALDKSDKGSSGGTTGDTKPSFDNKFIDSERFSGASKFIEDAYEAYAAPIVEGLGDSIHMMMELAIEEAEAALEEAEEMHDQAVEKVSESKDRLSELNEKMKDSSGAQLEQYKTQMADEMLLLQQREQEERRLQKEKEKREKELEKQKKKQRKLELQQQLIQAIVSGALAVVNGLATQPFMPVGIAMGALAGVATAIQIATITKQISKLADGGLLQGKSHAEGGIPVGSTGIEVEGGEYVVNKRSTAKYLPLLQQINEEGARHKTVANQLGKYADGGQLNYERINSNMDALNTAKIVSTAIEGIEMHPVVSVVDINRGQRNYAEIRQLAGASS